LLQSIDRDEQIGAFENFDQLVENSLVILVGPGLKIFLKYALRFTNGLKRQLLISHCSPTLKQTPEPKDKGRNQAKIWSYAINFCF
jgi:hypothetical protein